MKEMERAADEPALQRAYARALAAASPGDPARIGRLRGSFLARRAELAGAPPAEAPPPVVRRATQPPGGAQPRISAGRVLLGLLAALFVLGTLVRLVRRIVSWW